ncbi:MAG: VWA domain-containing protein [Planctomycetota bacterium]
MELISYRPLWWLLALAILAFGWKISLVDASIQKRFASLFFRMLAVVCLILALCRPVGLLQSNKLHIVFLVDVSQSIEPADAELATKNIRKSIEALNSGDTWSVYAFANGLRSFESPEKLQQLLDDWQEINADTQFRNESLISESLLGSRLSFPSDAMKRIVVFTDGKETGTELAGTLVQLNEEKIDVRWRKIQSLQLPEAAILSLEPSTRIAFAGEVVRLTTEVSANQNMSGKLRIIHRGVAVQTKDIQLIANRPQTVLFDVDMVTSGNSRWSVELIPDEDHFPINNQRGCTITVRGNPRILILHENERDMRPFERAMVEQDFSVEVRGKFGMPDNIQDMLAFDAMILSDFPATSMSLNQMNLLKRYVRDFGGGLAMLGSENSFGLGGYHRTPVEDVLPLVSRFEKEKEKPSLAMVLVIDKSGSMNGIPIQLARQAAKSAVDLLGTRDQIGVIGFDEQPTIINDVTSAASKDAVFANIDTLAASGGTNMYPAMVVGKEMLEEANAKIKHMICLSDGFTQDADHESLVDAMTSSGITISTVALGEADRNLMSRIAELGRGRYYETQDPANVPQIFTKETMQASKSAIKEDLYASVQTDDHPSLAGFQESDLPFSLGYVMTQPKPSAQTLLVTESGDPLLAVSRYGLGVGLAFTSDLTERWGGEWLAWPDCGKFWAQVLRSTIRQNSGEGIRVQTSIQNDIWKLDIECRDSNGQLQSAVPWELTVLDEQGKSVSMPVEEIGIGKYESEIEIENQRQLSVQLRDAETDRSRTIHFDSRYPKEYQLATDAAECMSELATIEPESIRDDIEPQSKRQLVVHWFYFAALVSLLIGNLLRRV